MRDEFLRRNVLLDETDPAPAFHSLIAQDKDGMWRVCVQKDDSERKATIAILPDIPQTPTFMRQVFKGWRI
ncbi:hypothetical protein [Iodobacter fluviatilis]|uniref:Uncharacterized protein n=1 Tax=Iodobacter fluviatilis TaxID=537 RepID=A0A7G3GCV6_9NEIS|nr:hypothetical protein [Iodobacter fluviatilis]QBC45307.1 hypothetical protein C1H71_18385 [Iodobacter fluviatilis]